MPAMISRKPSSQRDDVAEAREERRRARRRQGRVDRAGGLPGQALEQPPVGVDHRAEMPVGVERMTGRPSSAARSRAWARCCGGPQRPNQASFDGLKMKSGRLAPVDDLAREDDLVADLEAHLARSRARRSLRGPGPASKSRSPGREPRQADGGKERPHRQIFAIGDEVRLVVTADDPAARRDGEDAVGGAVERSRPSLDFSANAAGDEDVAGAEHGRGAHALELGEDLRARVAAFVAERLGDRRFGPEQQAAVPGFGQRQQGQPRCRLLAEASRHLSCWPMLGWTMRIGFDLGRAKLGALRPVAGRSQPGQRPRRR